MDKRGFELSIGFFVILILTVIIFAGSLWFLRQFYTTTEEFRQELDRDTEAQLVSLIRDGNIVAIPLNKARLSRGKGATFWLGVQNVLGRNSEFGVSVEFSKGFDAQETEIMETSPVYITNNWVLYSPGPHAIKNNDYQAIPIRVVVGDSIADNAPTPQGTYSFNVCVWDVSQYGATPPGTCDANSDLSVWYTKKIYKIFVEVP
ncbi:hypothetical protein HY493_05405 [Candidatus Woesearchaeota archaeon]|nr:hypothetical protein [Candidatus Woesearchaeota archaeon]